MSKELYKITVNTNDTVYKASGATAQEAISKLGLDYTQVKTKGTVTLTKGKKKSERFFYLRPLRMLVANKLRKAQVVRDLELLLKA